MAEESKAWTGLDLDGDIARRGRAWTGLEDIWLGKSRGDVVEKAWTGLEVEDVARRCSFGLASKMMAWNGR